MGLDYGFMGRNERLIYFLENYHELTREELNKELPDIWIDCEFPGLACCYSDWVEIFLEAGFCSDDGTTKPTDHEEKIELYRSAPSAYKYGMSWTSSYEMAEWFNERNHTIGNSDAKIYKTVVPKGLILAVLNSRNECEFVIDPEDAKVYGIETIECMSDRRKKSPNECNR